MRGFHESIELQRFCIGLERFPNMFITDSGSCKRCDNYKHIPKLFSAGNNMNPGSVPLEPTVSKTLTIA